MGMMNPMMMNQMNGMMNPMMMNQMSGMMNPMMMNQMNGMMNPMMMMTPEQKKEWQKQQRYLGYLAGKKMMEEKKKKERGGQSATTNPTTTPNVNPTATNATGEITVKFIKGGTTKNIKINSTDMVAELIDKYCNETHTTGTFSFNGANLDPMDCRGLGEAGIIDGSQINVS